MNKELTCIICPRGCHLVVDENNNVSGNFCPRGAKYAIQELTNPLRTITSTVKIISEDEDRLPVKTSVQVSKKLIFKVMEEINKIEVKAPVHIGDVLKENIAGSGANLVATKNIEK